MARHSTGVAIHIFRYALALYPGDFRERYGGNIAFVFEDSCDAAYGQWGVWGVWAQLARALADVVATATAERVSELGAKVGITSSLSLGATVAIHVTLLSVLLWVGFHAPPVAPSVCDQKAGPMISRSR